ncbi:FGGY family carbohydrate kinase [Planctomonas psychrotolerans]|uniref:FGGY family carbohydrate kinase n=1 Tax=Planctomonas psychrotolerans TaxID=2528712 RepID=UPI00123BEAB7|nr:FGGY family carbohydrate kinase [Planctomonas psychrotolerans]
MALSPSAPSRSSPPGLVAFGIDVGSTSTKVVAIRVGPTGTDPSGFHSPRDDSPRDDSPRELRVHSFGTPADPTALLSLTADAVTALVDEVGQPATVGVASMAESGVLLDAAASALTDVVRWDGTVAPAALLEALGGGEARALHARTGIVASAKVPLVLWADLWARHPTLWERASRWVGVADLVVLAITGKAVTDPTLAVRTMAVTRPERPGEQVRFDPDLCARAGLETSRLPSIVPHDGWAGRAVSTAGFGALAPGIPIVVAGHDHVVAAWAVGARSPGSEVDSVGTSEAIVRLFTGPDVPATAFDEGMSVGIDVTGTLSTLIAGSAAAGRAVREWTTRGSAPAAAVSRVDAEDVLRPAESIVQPYPAGRQSPRPDPDATMTLDGRDPRDLDPARIAALTPALLDGLALHARWMRDAQTAVLGAPPTGDLVVVGRALGLDDPWLRRKAAAFGRPVLVPAVSEPVACGAAMLALERTVRPSAPPLPLREALVPTENAVAAYAAAFPRFLATATERTP